MNLNDIIIRKLIKTAQDAYNNSDHAVKIVNDYIDYLMNHNISNETDWLIGYLDSKIVSGYEGKQLALILLTQLSSIIKVLIKQDH